MICGYKIRFACSRDNRPLHTLDLESPGEQLRLRSDFAESPNASIWSRYK